MEGGAYETPGYDPNFLSFSQGPMEITLEQWADVVRFASQGIFIGSKGSGCVYAPTEAESLRLRMQVAAGPVVWVGMNFVIFLLQF